MISLSFSKKNLPLLLVSTMKDSLKTIRGWNYLNLGFSTWEHWPNFYTPYLGSGWICEVPIKCIQVYQRPASFHFSPSHVSLLNYLFSSSGSQPFLDFVGNFGKAAQNSKLTSLGLPTLDLRPIILCSLGSSLMLSKDDFHILFKLFYCS